MARAHRCLRQGAGEVRVREGWSLRLVAIDQTLCRPRSFRASLGVWTGDNSHACSRGSPAAATHALLDCCILVAWR
jgi:hypothetical protein